VWERPLVCRHRPLLIDDLHPVGSPGFVILVRRGMPPGPSLSLLCPLYDELLAWKRRRHGRGQLELEPDEMSEAGGAAVRQHELIEGGGWGSVWAKLTRGELGGLTLPGRGG